MTASSVTFLTFLDACNTILLKAQVTPSGQEGSVTVSGEICNGNQLEKFRLEFPPEFPLFF